MIVLEVASSAAVGTLSRVDGVFHGHGDVTGVLWCSVSWAKGGVGCVEFLFKEDVDKFIGRGDIFVEFFGPFDFAPGCAHRERGFLLWGP